MTDMKHMEFLEAVAASDVDAVRQKESTYQGSWKRRGGVGAFMMLARKWDRLETMLGGSYKYDIFQAIAAQRDQDEADGTTIAEVRDLRRYLILVEAEMLARDVVMLPKAARAASFNCFEHAPPLSSERRVPRYEAETTTHRRVGDIAKTETVIERHFEGGANGMKPGDRVIYEIDGRVGTAKEFLQDGDATVKFDNGLRDTVKWRHLRPETSKQRTPEDGGQHASLVPWVADRDYFIRRKITADEVHRFWCHRAPGVHVLEPVLAGAEISPVVHHLYVGGGDMWILRINLCPPDARQFFPSLDREKNAKEHEELPAWQRGMYAWHESENKFVLIDACAAWHAEEQ